MLNIMLVDDEVLVRTNIKLMLSQYENDFSICGEASSAEEAIEILSKLNPDVILSDMVMPGMDGVELCRYVYSNNLKSHFVALSNYDDYRLVHDTLKNGGEDYLLKHELTAERLKETLISMKPIDESRVVDTKELSTFQEKFVLDLITCLITDSRDIEYQIKALDLRIDSTNIVQILMRVDNYAKVTNENDLQRKRTIDFSIVNIGNEILKTYQSGILTHIEGEYYSILLSFAQEHSQAVIYETIHNVIRQISSNLKTYLNIVTSFVVGKWSDAIGTVPENYRIAYQIMKHDCFSETGAVIFADAIDNRNAKDCSDAILDKKLEKVIAESFYNPNADEAEESVLEEVFSKLRSQKLDYKATNNVLMKLLGIFIEVCKTNSIEFSTINKSDTSPFEQLSAMSTLEQAKEWFQEYYKKINALLSDTYQGNSEYARKCLIYIRTNYKEPISLDTAAEKIGISKSYLSTQFKEEVGIGFNEYLNSYRIKNAKMLMRQEQDLHEVALETGFQDYSYFFKVFKKMTGITPAEYKRQGAVKEDKSGNQASNTLRH